MAQWWNSLSVLSQVYFCIAVAATVILIIQSVLLFFGVGDSAEAGDFDGSFDGEGLSLFSIRGIVAFLTIGGWVGMWLSTTSAPVWLVIIISLVAGIAALVVIALIMKAFSRMQSNGSMDLANAIGKTATVYLRVPKNGDGNGKVTLTFGGRFAEMDAISQDAREYSVSALVKVVGVLGDNLIVSALEEPVQTDDKSV